MQWRAFGFEQAHQSIIVEISNKFKCVKMDKVIKEMTVRTSSQNKNSKILVKPHEELEDFPSKENENLSIKFL